MLTWTVSFACAPSLGHAAPLKVRDCRGKEEKGGKLVNASFRSGRYKLKARVLTTSPSIARLIGFSSLNAASAVQSLFMTGLLFVVKLAGWLRALESCLLAWQSPQTKSGMK